METLHTNELYTSLGDNEIYNGANGLMCDVRDSSNKDQFVPDIYMKKTSKKLHEGGEKKWEEEEKKIKEEL